MAEAFKYAHLSGAGGTTAVAGKAMLHAIIVNTAGTTVTLYDSASGANANVIAVLGPITGTFVYDVECGLGITVVIAGTGDVTVSYAAR